jgi:hypothetical protein
MDEREQQRKVDRLAVLRHADDVNGSVAATCRYYGISRRSSTSGVAGVKTRGRWVWGTSRGTSATPTLEALRETTLWPPRSGGRQVHRTTLRTRKQHYQYTATGDCARIRVGDAHNESTEASEAIRLGSEAACARAVVRPDSRVPPPRLRRLAWASGRSP